MRTTPIMAAPALLACGAALAVSALLAGCGSGAGSGAGNGGAGPIAQSSATPDTTTEAIVHCYRSHGDPSFPDPVYDPNDGRWHFAISPGSAPESTQQACRHLFPSVNASPPVPLAQFQQLVRLAQCIRQHGVPNWPDPDPDGSFPLPPSIQKGRVTSAAMTACQRYMPAGGIDAHAVP
jgi:hypothetical protein